MQWRKAHEALPDDNKSVIVRWSQYAPDDRIDISNAHQLKVWMEERPTVTFCWLDETEPTPPASAVEEAERMYPYLQGENAPFLNALAYAARQAHITCAGMYTDTIEKLRNVLQDLVDAVPKQQVNVDWWDDSMTNAMKQAQELLK